MRLSVIGRCGNCNSLTSRVTPASDNGSDDKRDRRVYQCRTCSAKGIKPVTHVKNKAGNALPRHIEDALAAASYQMRSPDGDGFPRVVVTIPAFGSVMVGGQGGEDIVTRIERAWPELDDVQINRVVRHIDAGCTSAIRAMTEAPGRPKRRWLTDGVRSYPIKTCRDF